MATSTQEQPCSKGYRRKPHSKRFPAVVTGKHPNLRQPRTAKLLSGRAVAIIGASLVIAVSAGTLTYLTAGKSGASLAEAILVGAAAFGGAIRLLDSIIN